MSLATAPRGWQRWLPRTLFGRLLGVLAGGLLVAQLLSAAINLAERDRLLDRSFGMQPVQRIVDVVALLDDAGAAERERLQAVFRSPPFVLTLAAAPRVPAGEPATWHAQMFASRLVQRLEAFAGAATAARWQQAGQHWLEQARRIHELALVDLGFRPRRIKQRDRRQRVRPEPAFDALGFGQRQ